MPLKIYTYNKNNRSNLDLKGGTSSYKINRVQKFREKQSVKSSKSLVSTVKGYEGRNLTWSQRFNRANTGFFRFIGVFSFSLLFFISFSLFNTNSKANALAVESSIVSGYVEVLPSKDVQTQLASKTVSKKESAIKAESAIEVKEYIVKAGDNLYSICSDNKLNCSDLIHRNNLEVPYSLKVGQVLNYIK